MNLQDPSAPRGEESQKGGWFRRLRNGLSKTRDAFLGRLESALGRFEKLDADALDALEEILYTADMGPRTVGRILEKLRRGEGGTGAPIERVRRIILGLLEAPKPGAPPGAPPPGSPRVILMVGVNGAGKTTTAGKLAARYAAEGKKVILAAADTFRAGAGEQISIWAERSGCEVIRLDEGADPSAVVFDALQAARARGADILLADTAGRLHTQKNLMEELKKVRRVVGRQVEGAPHEVLLVLDATSGQNVLVQVREFGEALGVTGLVLTKIDGTAKGGVVVGAAH
ncbi:MAG: signal recognition particle-docking protein FtsY, partial [bacterium]|nr:signal recognition particle-docking protein FtsY [bacterium]